MIPTLAFKADRAARDEQMPAPLVTAWGDREAADEAGLLERLQQRDEEAYEIVVRRHGARMLRTARRLLRDEDLAGEAVQDAFLNAFRSIGRFREDARLATWLHRIVVNAALMKLRRAARRPEISLDSLANGVAEDTRHDATRPRAADDDLVQEELRATVRAAIERLPPTGRSVIMLRDIEERSVAETARVLGVSENAVKIRLHRAHQALQKALAPAA